MSRAQVVIAVVAAVLVPACSASAMTPSVVGWPVATPAGELLPGVDGDGAVVTSKVVAINWAQVLVAYRSDLTRRWRTVIDLDDDNGDTTPVTRRNQDGSYGPVGVFPRRAGIWNVDATGRIRPGCFGPVLADGTCIETTRAVEPAYVIRKRSAAGVEVWRLTAGQCCELLQAPVLDGTGTVYSAEGSGFGFRLMAVDPASGTARWERHVQGQILTALDRGVVIAEPGAVRAIGDANEDRWSVTLSGADATGAVADVRRRQVLVQTRDGEGRGRVHALSMTAGAVLWSRPGVLVADSATGRRYVAEGTATDLGNGGRVAAYAASGRVLWRRTFAQPVAGVREQRDGTVLVSTGSRDAGMLHRLDPSRPAVAVARSDVDISTHRTRSATFGVPSCLVGSGIVLRVRLRTAATVRLRYRGFPTTARPAGGPLVERHRLPAGERHLLLAIGPGPSTIRVDWRENGRTVVKRFAVTGVRCPA